MATLHCPSCGYNLTGPSVNRCPECGQAFDPAVLAAADERGLSETIHGRGELARRAHFGRIVVVQALVALPLSILLDGGAMLNAYLISLAAYWGAVMLALARRRTFSRRDLDTIRLGWIIIAVVGLFAVPALLELMLRAREAFRR